jgi:hypothetical protein
MEFFEKHQCRRGAIRFELYCVALVEFDASSCAFSRLLLVVLKKRCPKPHTRVISRVSRLPCHRECRGWPARRLKGAVQSLIFGVAVQVGERDAGIHPGSRRHVCSGGKSRTCQQIPGGIWSEIGRDRRRAIACFPLTRRQVE